MILFADLHGHDAALRRLLEREPDGRIVSVGDVLGLRGSNAECLRLMGERGIPSVQGNHELRMLNFYREGLEDSTCRKIASWPLEFVDPEALVVHTYMEDGDFFDVREEQALRMLQRCPLVFTGHIHEPGWWEWDGFGRPRWQSSPVPSLLIRSDGTRYLIQIGSLGEGNPPCYVAWDGQRVEWRGLP